MADGSIIIDTHIDNEQAHKDLNALTKEIKKLQTTLSTEQGKQNAIEKEMIDATNAAETTRAKIAELKAELANVERVTDISNTANVGDPSTVIAAMEQQKVIESEIATQNKLLDQQTKRADAVSKKYADISTKVSQITANLDAAQTKAGALTQKLTTGGFAAGAMAKAGERAQKTMHRLSLRLREVVRSALIFTVITQSLAKLRNLIGANIKADKELRAALAGLKGAWLTAFQPVWEIISPALLALMRILTAVANVISNVFSFFTGKSTQEMADNAKALEGEREALEGVGGAAKDASKSLAGFDEINKLDSAENAGGGGGASAGNIPTDFSAMDAIKDKFGELEIYVSGALLALGAILAFTGANIPLGIGLMAVGAIGLATAVAANWNSMPPKIKKALTLTTAVLGGAALVVGAILAFSGVKIGLGIALMAIGAASLAGTAALNWDTIKNKLKGPVGAVTALVGAALLAVGAILAFTGVKIGLGIALMAAGAAAIGSSAFLNWDTIKQKLQGPVGVVTAIVSAALLALGTILAFSGAALPLGIALIAAGAAGLATISALNWDTIKQKLQGPVGVVTAIASGALLALGLILAFSGVGLPLGIALIAAGATGLVSVTALNWNAILEKLQSAFQNIKNWWNTSVKQYFTLEFWQEKFSTIGEALKSRIKAGVNGAIGILNQFIAWVNEKLQISWSGITLPGGKQIPGGGMQLISIPSIPYLAQGAVIPPNREFMAVLGDQKSGTNIETPLATMVQAFRQALNEGGGGATRTIVLEVDKRELGRVTFDVYNAEAQRLGVSLGGA